jgi:tetratricopeptide (TPR) repeat protein
LPPQISFENGSNDGGRISRLRGKVAMSAFGSSQRIQIFYFIGALILPAACLAQTAAPGKSSYVVSVQELQMSGKAKKAFTKGSELLAKGDSAGSLPYLDRAVSESPENYSAYYDLGLAHYGLGHIAEAEQAFQKSIDLTQGTFAPPQFGMGMVLCREGEFQQAETVLQRGLEREPGSASGKYLLAWAQYGLNRLLAAERSLQEAILRNSHFSEAYLLLARIHQRQNNTPAMTQDLQTYLKLNPTGPESEQTRRLLERTTQQMHQKPIAVLYPLFVQ